MPKDKRIRREAFARWQDEGGAVDCGPQVPGAARDCPDEAPADWRSETLERVRSLIREADPEAAETVKWRKPSNPAGVPVWEHGGIICTGETYRDKVKLTFARGAALPDPKRLFNSSLEGKTRRAIDISEADEIDAEAFRALVRAAVAENLARRG